MKVQSQRSAATRLRVPAPETAPFGAVSRPNAEVAVSELPRQSAEEPSTRSILRGEDADACSASNLIDLVRHVDDIEAHRERTGASERKLVAQAEIDLVIARSVIAVRDHVPVGKSKIVAQAGAEWIIDAEASAEPQVGHTAGSGYPS